MEEIKEDNALISVIMPAYNAESTITRAINSVLRQDYHNIELIVVNDGSSDRTEAVSKQIMDDRLIIVNQTNLGLSGARNTGLYHTKGDYIMFVDSDDWVEPNYISLLYESLMDNNASLSICGMVRDFPNDSHQRISFSSSSSFADCYNNESFLSLFEGGLINSCCNKIYKKTIIEKNKLSFSGKVLVEDIEFNLKYLQLSDLVNTVMDCPYHYVVESGSLTSKVSEDMIQNYMYVHKFFLNLLPIKYYVFANRFVYHQYLNIILKYLEKVALGTSKRDEVYPLLKSYNKESLVRKSFDSYSPVNYKEAAIYYCLRMGLFDIVVIYLRNKAINN